jgi:hypothetical protein
MKVNRYIYTERERGEINKEVKILMERERERE